MVPKFSVKKFETGCNGENFKNLLMLLISYDAALW